MRDHLPEEHNVFAAALPELVEHFEAAAKHSGDYAFVLDSITEDLRRAHTAVELHGVEKSTRAIDSAKQTLIAIAEEPDFAALGGALAGALNITQKHQKKGPGL